MVSPTVVFSGMPVASLERAEPWWRTLLGREPDMRPHAQEVAWRLNDGAWVFVVVDAERAGRATLVLIVEDLSAAVAELRGRGVAVGASTPVGGGREVALSDPDGNRVRVVQVG